jgi:hypothetical protein
LRCGLADMSHLSCNLTIDLCKQEYLTFEFTPTQTHKAPNAN